MCRSPRPPIRNQPGRLTQTAGRVEGELSELFEDFSEGRVQYAFVKVKDPNSGLPKMILVAWCGGGVPERTKGYFTSHTAAVAKVLHGYHVQITARSDSDLDPASIMQKVADASGSKYSAGSSAAGASPSAPPPSTTSKPVFTPSTASAARNPVISSRSRKDEDVDEDGWGADAPPVTRTMPEKVESAYKPTKVNMAELRKQESGSRIASSATRQDDGPSDVVKGGYQPVGKVDIAAIRAQANRDQDDRPGPVKGAYEPTGKVDIAAIRAKAQKPAPETPDQPEEPSEPERPKDFADRAAAFSQPSQSERLTSLPKPKVANRFGGGPGIAGTKPPVPSSSMGLHGPSGPAPPPVGSASRTFADQGGKTPAQLWAEKKARERGGDVPSATAPAPSSVEPQKSGGAEWKSGYSGKSWAPVQTSSSFGRPEAGQVSQENTGEQEETSAEEPPNTGVGGVSALKDRFKDAPPMGTAAAPPVPRAAEEDDAPAPPPVPDSSRPAGGFSLPGLPSRPAPAEEPEEEPEREESPPRVAVPVGRGPVEEPEEEPAPPPLPSARPDADADVRQVSPPPQQPEAEPVAPEPVGQAGQAGQAGQVGIVAVVQFDYEKAEDNEVELIEGEYVTEIDMIDEGWWIGTNAKGERGLFPCNYVEVAEGGPEQDTPPPPAPPRETVAAPAPAEAEEAVPAPAPRAAAVPSGPTATALYDYEAAEDNGEFAARDATSFPALA